MENNILLHVKTIIHILVFIQGVIWGEAGGRGHSHKTVIQNHRCLHRCLFTLDLLSYILTWTNRKTEVGGGRKR